MGGHIREAKIKIHREIAKTFLWRGVYANQPNPFKLFLQQIGQVFNPNEATAFQYEQNQDQEIYEEVGEAVQDTWDDEGQDTIEMDGRVIDFNEDFSDDGQKY